MSEVRPNPGSRWLIAGGWLSLAASLLHLACIAGGPDWYRFFGAGEEIAQAAERGSWMPAILTFGIATMLAVWAAFAFSGAGRIRRLPLLRTGLVAISAIYLARGLIVFPLLAVRPEGVNAFGLWSSLVVLVYGVAYAVGTFRAWESLTPRTQTR